MRRILKEPPVNPRSTLVLYYKPERGPLICSKICSKSPKIRKKVDNGLFPRKKVDKDLFVLNDSSDKPRA